MSELSGPDSATWASWDVTERVNYWHQLWEDLVDWRHDFRGLELRSPHLLVRDLSDEIDAGLRNPHNVRYFQRELDNFIKFDRTLKPFSATLRLLRQQFGKPRLGYFKELCRALLDQFGSWGYAKAQVAELKRIVTNPAKDDGYDGLLRASESLIIELSLKGYSWKFIHALPSNILANYSERGGHIITDFPHDLDDRPFKTSSANFDYFAYNAALKKLLDDLTPGTRIERIAPFLDAAPVTRYFIFQIEGLRPDFQDPAHNLAVGNVSFYWPREHRFLEPSELEEDETFGADEDCTFINVAVRAIALPRDNESGWTAAVQDAERALDVLRAYIGDRRAFRVRKHQYIVGDDSRKSAGAAHSFAQDLVVYMESANIKDAKITLKDELLRRVSALVEAVPSVRTDIERRLLWSLRWLRKAEEVTNPEDTLLFNWIVLETLAGVGTGTPGTIQNAEEEASPIEFAKEVIPSIVLENLRFEVAHNLHRRLVSDLSAVPRRLTLPEELITRCHLKPAPYSQINLADLVAHLDKLEPHVARSRLADWIAHARQFYSDPSAALKIFERRRNSLSNYLLLIYRLRNRIVHSAHHEHAFLQHYARQAEMLAGSTLRSVLESYALGGRRSVREILLAAHSQVSILAERLKDQEKFDLLESAQ